MRTHQINECLISSIEEEYQGHKIYIENCADAYCGGFDWAICNERGLIDSGHSFDVEDALLAAQRSVLASSPHGV